MVHTIIFDIGETLVAGPDLFGAIADELEQRHGVKLRDRLAGEFEVLQCASPFSDVKTILDVITRKVLNECGISDSVVKASKIYADIFINKSWLFEGALEILEYLKKKKINLIVVSDADSDVLIPELKKLKIYDYFDDIIISSDIKCYKLSKHMARHVLPKIKKPYKDILFVGDSNVDMATAKVLGVKSVFVNRVGKNIESDFTIRNLFQLKELI